MNYYIVQPFLISYILILKYLVEEIQIYFYVKYETGNDITHEMT